MHPRGIRSAKALAVIVTALIVASGCATSPPSAGSTADAAAVPVETTHHHPIIVVPGFEFDCAPRTGDWARWITAAAARGFDDRYFIIMRPDPCAPNTETASALGALVDRVLAATGDTHVDIVAHSMGSLAARWCIRFGSCAGKVDKYMGLAAANHGTIWANLCAVLFWSHSCGDMAPASTMLAALNEGDETWGDTKYATVNSWCDLVIVPFTSTFMVGADNRFDPRCIAHSDWKKDSDTIARTFAWFNEAPTIEIPAVAGQAASPWT